MRNSDQISGDPVLVLVLDSYRRTDAVLHETSLWISNMAMGSREALATLDAGTMRQIAQASEMRANGAAESEIPYVDPTLFSEGSRLMRASKIVQSKVPGTDEFRKSLDQYPRGLVMEMGLPISMVTVNPSETRNPLRDRFGGYEVDLDDPTTFRSVEQRAKDAAGNPVRTALFFEFFVGALLNTLIVPNDGFGIFGNIRAVFGVYENQVRGSLHLHLLLWLWGMPTMGEMDRMMSTLGAAQRVLAYVNSTLSCDFEYLDPSGGYRSAEKPVQNRVLAQAIVNDERADPAVVARLKAALASADRSGKLEAFVSPEVEKDLKNRDVISRVVPRLTDEDLLRPTADVLEKLKPDQLQLLMKVGVHAVCNATCWKYEKKPAVSRRGNGKKRHSKKRRRTGGHK